MDTVAEKIGMPLDEFIQLYNEQPFELIKGERIPKMPNITGHNEANRAMFRALDHHTLDKQLGEVIYESPFVLSYTSHWVTGSRTPDVMYYTMERITAYKQADPDYKLKPYVLVPDLVVEVVSPNDNLTELDDKVDQYLLDGVRKVWVLNPQKKTVVVHTLTSRQPFTKQEIHLTMTDTLTGNDVVPGFEIPVAHLFA